ncbi:MAG: IS630 family transposase [Chromatiaceae bacterium]
MLDYRLSKQELAELRAAHRRALNVREAYRINAVVVLGNGRTAADVADALLIDPETVRSYVKRYQKGGVDELLRMNDVGSESWLDEVQLAQLDAHLQEHLPLTAESVARWVKERWGVCYAASGMAAVLRRLGDVDKKPKRVPGKANAAAQREFLEDYEILREISGGDDVVMFMDATHPQHHPVISCGWIKRGAAHPIKSNTGRRRLNLNGAIDVQRMSAQIRCDDTIDAIATIALFEQIERANPLAKRSTIICDNARYYRSKAVSEYLENSRIDLLFLPPYSPNLNLIERFWKFFKRQVLYNHYYEAFNDYKNACKRFFRELDSYVPRLRSLLTENSEIIGN